VSAWQPFFSTQAEVSAALTGLVFVALSINLRQILEIPGMANRAGEALLLLLLPVLVGLAGALPQTSTKAFGAEILVVGVVVALTVTAIVARGYQAQHGRPTHEFLIRALSAEVGVLTTVTAGVILLAGHPGGLWWQAASTALCIGAGVGDAWVLLVEILR
jgi:putative effector of murein hydrolase LrgA (UPF0299 family)